jgi:hypothetical protein
MKELGVFRDVTARELGKVSWTVDTLATTQCVWQSHADITIVYFDRISIQN